MTKKLLFIIIIVAYLAQTTLPTYALRPMVSAKENHKKRIGALLGYLDLLFIKYRATLLIRLESLEKHKEILEAMESKTFTPGQLISYLDNYVEYNLTELDKSLAYWLEVEQHFKDIHPQSEHFMFEVERDFLFSLCGFILTGAQELDKFLKENIEFIQEFSDPALVATKESEKVTRILQKCKKTDIIVLGLIERTAKYMEFWFEFKGALFPFAAKEPMKQDRRVVLPAIDGAA